MTGPSSAREPGGLPAPGLSGPGAARWNMARTPEVFAGHEVRQTTPGGTIVHTDETAEARTPHHNATLALSPATTADHLLQVASTSRVSNLVWVDPEHEAAAYEHLRARGLEPVMDLAQMHLAQIDRARLVRQQQAGRRHCPAGGG